MNERGSADIDWVRANLKTDVAQEPKRPVIVTRDEIFEPIECGVHFGQDGGSVADEIAGMIIDALSAEHPRNPDSLNHASGGHAHHRVRQIIDDRRQRPQRGFEGIGKRARRPTAERRAFNDVGRAHVLSEKGNMRRFGFDQPHFASTP